MPNAQPETDLPYWKLDEPRKLLGQTRAVALMRSDNRASYKHHALIEFHWGWANKNYGWTSLASVRRIHEVLKERNPLGQPGMTTRHIGEANRDLCKWGWLFELDKGKGRNASRFLPNYAVFEIAATGNFSKFLNGEISCSVSPVGTHNEHEISVSPMGLHMRIPCGDTQITVAYPMQGHKDPLTETGLLDRSTERGIECAAPTAPPPPPAIAADGADTAQEETKATTTTKTGFEALWRAYNYKRGKTEARAAYAKLAPDADLHAAMVASAIEWQASWAAQNKPDAPRYTLAKWIEREDFECEPPTAYKPKERKAKTLLSETGKSVATQPTAPAAPTPDNDDIPDSMRGSPKLWPAGRHLVEIREAYTMKHASETYVVLNCMVIEGGSFGQMHEHRICVRSTLLDSQEAEGQATVLAVFEAAGVFSSAGLDGLIFKRVVVIANGSSLKYEAHGYREAA